MGRTKGRIREGRRDEKTMDFCIACICTTAAFTVLFKFAVSQFTFLFTLFLVSFNTLMSSYLSTEPLAPISAKTLDISSPSFMYME